MENPNEHPTQAAINELTLALLYLTRFGNPKDRVLRTSWLEYDRQATHQLTNEGLLTHRSRYHGFYKEKWHAFRPKLNASLQTLHTIESLKDERTSFKLDGFSFSCEQ